MIILGVKGKGVRSFTQQRGRVLAAGRRLRRRVPVLQKGRVVNADMRLLGEFPEPQRSVQVQLPSLLLSAPPKIFLLQVQTNTFCAIRIEEALVSSAHCAQFIQFFLLHSFGFLLHSLVMCFLFFFFSPTYLVLSYPLQLR